MALTQPVGARGPAGDGVATAVVDSARPAVGVPLAVVLVVGAASLFHFWYIAAGWINLAPDEAQYWDWSRRLDWSYYSKGPMVAYLIALSTRLGGDSEFFVRLPAVLLGAATCLLAYALTRQLFGSAVAWLALLAYLACPLFAAGSGLMTTDVPLGFFWVLAVFALWRAAAATGARAWAWWLGCGAAVGLGLLSKYTMAFFFVGLAAYLGLAPGRRAQLGTPKPYVAVVLSLLLFSPVVIWNAAHDWLSLRHVAALAGLSALLPESHRPLASFAEFVGGQLGVVSPLLFCAAAAAVGRSAWLGIRKGADAHLLLASFSLPLLLYFLLWSLVDKIEPNWPAPAYATALIAAAAWWQERFEGAPSPQRRRRLRQGLAVALGLGVLITAVAHFSALLPLAGIRLAPRRDPTDRLRGWQELGQRVGGLLARAPGPAPFLMAPSYQMASELAFYTPGHPRVYEIDLGRRQSQYDVWGGLEERRGENGLFVTYGDWPAEALGVICERPRQLDVMRVWRAEQPIETFSMFACDGFKGTPQFDVPPTF